jgi:hypothetical protein
VSFDVVGPYGKTSAERVKKGKRRKVCFLPLRSTAQGAIKRNALEPSVHDQAQA